MEDGRHARRAQSGTRRAGRPSSISIVDECGSDLALFGALIMSRPTLTRYPPLRRWPSRACGCEVGGRSAL